jgi:Na+/H+-dicarboxylate symporter
LIVLPLLLRFLGGVSPWKHVRAVLPALTTAFSTSSSSATLPVTIECLQENAGVSPRTTNFVTPLGATVNMDGTALYECVAVIFLAQVYGAGLTLGSQVMIVVLALLTSIGVAGVPSASLVAIVVILSALNLPIEGIGLLMVFDRILDMCRTSVNVLSDSCGAVIIARSEGETTAVALDSPAAD